MKLSVGFFSKVILQLLILGVVNTKENTKGATVKTTPFDSNEKVNGIPTGESVHNLRSAELSPKTLSAVDYPQARKYTSDYTHRNILKGDDKSFCEYSQDDVECSDLDGDCLDCDYDSIKHSCVYGRNVIVRCNATATIVCKGKRSFQKEIVCQYCYQTPTWQQRCSGLSHCNSVAAPPHLFKANCTVAPNILCFGSRRFNRMMPCNWKNGYRWSTTFILSITLGGFGADRFYLGRWQEGIGKLFSFGGLGLWTIVDIILIGVRYLGPADGSLYVD